MADEDTQIGSQTEEQLKPVETDTETGLPAQEPADPNAYPELAPTPPSVVDDEAATVSEDTPAVGEPAPEIPASVAVEQPVAVERDPLEDAPPDFVARMKQWVRDEIELMQMGKSRQQREDVHNP